MLLPAEIIPILAHFAPAITAPTYQKALILVVGTILAQGRRTVTSALQAVGHAHTADWAKYHHFLNRARWSGLQVSRQPLALLVVAWDSADTLLIAVDETLERRWGPQIRKCGHWRDSRAVSINPLLLIVAYTVDGHEHYLGCCAGVTRSSCLLRHCCSARFRARST